MTALAGFAKQVNGSASDDLAPVAHKCFDHLFEVQHFWFAVYQRHHVDTHHGLKLRLCIQVVEYHVPYLTSTQLDHNAQAVFVRLVSQLGNTLELLLFDQLRDSLNQA